MKTTVVRIFFISFIQGVIISLSILCQSATADEIKAKMQRVESEITRIDREIAIMKKNIDFLQTEKNRISSCLLNPKNYALLVDKINEEGVSFIIIISEAQLDELAATAALDCLLYEKEENQTRCDIKRYKLILKELSEETEKRLPLRLDQIDKKISELERDIAQHTKEKERLTNEFLALERSRKEGAVQKPSSQQLSIIEATYGWNCKNFKPWDGKPNTVSKGNATKFIKASCNGKGSCKYLIDYKKIGDPAYGCQKEYEVTYKCMPSGKTFTKKVAKEAGWGDKTVTLSCP